MIMADVHDKETRSYNMSQIKGKDTKPEMIVRKYLFANGIRYRLHDKTLPGKPDIVIKKLKTIIDVRGCFWHGHENCKYFVIPKTRTAWWMQKIGKTKELDKLNLKKVKMEKWQVITIHECHLRRNNLKITICKLSNRLKRSIHFPRI